MQKKFITNLFFLLVLNLLIKPFYILGIDAEIINRVGAETYGIYFSLFNFSFLFNIFLDFGINNFNTKNVAQNEHLLSKYFSKLFSLKLILVLAYVFFTISAGFIWGYSNYALKLLLILAFNQGLVAIILYLRSNLSGIQMFVKDSVISVLDRFLMILFCSVLLWGNVTDRPFEIEWFIYTQTLSYTITLFVGLFWVWQKSAFVKIKYNHLFSFAIIKQSAPYALLILLMTFYYRSDSVMLEKLLEMSSKPIKKEKPIAVQNLSLGSNQLIFLLKKGQATRKEFAVSAIQLKAAFSLAKSERTIRNKLNELEITGHVNSIEGRPKKYFLNEFGINYIQKQSKDVLNQY